MELLYSLTIVAFLLGFILGKRYTCKQMVKHAKKKEAFRIWEKHYRIGEV